MPPIYDQGELGSCTANAIAAGFAFQLFDQELPVINPSRLFIYYNERAVEGSISTDAGAVIADGVKAVNTLGVPDESLWPYDITKFAVKPSDAAYALALRSVASEIVPIAPGLINVIRALAAGYPVIFGFTVFESFESKAVAVGGDLPMPGPTEAVLGGHAVVAVGYTDDGYFLVRNSWGDKWGIAGHFRMPFDFLAQYASDFWTIRKVTELPAPAPAPNYG
jgi:C1A family cysteine protease